jgi:transketolase
MALAERMLAAEFNRAGHEIVDHRTYVFLGDGCLMEGVSHEACSLAGTLGLGKLICFYDDNGISIDGDVHGWFTDDTPQRFRAYGWHVIPGVDGQDAEAVRRAVEESRAVTDRPSLICCRTVIGYGAPNKQGTESTHGAPLGVDEVAAARNFLDWPHPPFVVPDEIRAAWDQRARGAALEHEWQARLADYRREHPALAAEFERRMRGDLPADFADRALEAALAAQRAGGSTATRQSSQAVLNAYGALLPELRGGSADLTGSNNTMIKGSKSVSRSEPGGHYIHYGVREFGMAAIMNGIALHGGHIPYGGTFLVFSDYARSALRMASMMRLQSIFVLTHDSIGLGEDGPTHQPVEHLASLRVIPGMHVWRPCDTVETHAAWAAAIERRDGPSSLVLTRQAVPHQSRTPEQVADIRRGGYVLVDCPGTPECILIATGSEVSLAVEAAATLTAKGRRVRVVSMPCTRVFDAQDAGWQERVLPKAVRCRVAVEAGSTDGWWRYVGCDGRVIGMTTFGASGPAKQLYEHFGITADAVVAAAGALLAG